MHVPTGLFYITVAMDSQRCTLKRKRSSTNVNGSSPAPENSLGGQTLPETDPFIEYGRATQEEEDFDASDFDESIDRPEEILLTYQTILNINENKFIFGTLPENPIPPLPSTSRLSSYVSKIAPEFSKPSRTQKMHAKQKKDSLKDLRCQNSHGQGPRIPGPKTLDDTNSAKRPR